MKTDYNKLMKEQIKNLTAKPKLLLHVCCAPCSAGVLDRLQNFDITLYYYNPNTFPQQEYDLRFDQFQKLTKFDIVKEEYIHNDFLKTIKGLEQEKEGGKRCEKCITLRMEQSFKYAQLNGFDFITTTLSVSPHKNADFINTQGKLLQEKYDIKYLFADFKKDNGFLKSITKSKELSLYRQDYCGCEFSFNKKN